jgi:hypothetical protein
VHSNKHGTVRAKEGKTHGIDGNRCSGIQKASAWLVGGRAVLILTRQKVSAACRLLALVYVYIPFFAYFHVEFAEQFPTERCLITASFLSCFDLKYFIPRPQGKWVLVAGYVVRLSRAVCYCIRTDLSSPACAILIIEVLP